MLTLLIDELKVKFKVKFKFAATVKRIWKLDCVRVWFATARYSRSRTESSMLEAQTVEEKLFAFCWLKDTPKSTAGTEMQASSNS